MSAEHDPLVQPGIDEMPVGVEEILPGEGAADAAVGGEAPGAGLLDRRPELGVAAGFAGGFLIATVVRRLGR